MHLDSTFNALSNSSNSINKWVFLGENVIFCYFNIFFPTFLNMFDSRFLLLPPK